jgi:aminoglycoside phosphotransferase (APT) family kinase protein
MPTLVSTFDSLQQARVLAAAGPCPEAEAQQPSSLALIDALRSMELLAPGDTPRVTPIGGAAKGRVLRVELGWGTVCVKRAEADRADAEYRLAADGLDAEVRWLKMAQNVVPGCAPAVLGSTAAGAAFAMEYLAAEEFPLWRARLAGGNVEPWIGAELGHLLGRIHAASAGSSAVMAHFGSRHTFEALRAGPLFARAAQRHPDCAWELRRVESMLSTSRVALVHGDLRPDNLLVGPRGPVLLDADLAHFGDPMVDVASFLAELMLRIALHPLHRPALASCWDAFERSYFAHVTWEMPEQAEARAAALLAAFALDALDRPEAAGAAAYGDGLRDALRASLLAPPRRIEPLRDAWRQAVAAH